jgi:hypothetical protein
LSTICPKAASARCLKPISPTGSHRSTIRPVYDGFTTGLRRAENGSPADRPAETPDHPAKIASKKIGLAEELG